MHKHTLHIGLLGLALALSATALAPTPQTSRTAVANLRTEYLVDPMAIDTRAPRLSWIVSAPIVRDVKQAVRIWDQNGVPSAWSAPAHLSLHRSLVLRRDTCDDIKHTRIL